MSPAASVRPIGLQRIGKEPVPVRPLLQVDDLHTGSDCATASCAPSTASRSRSTGQDPRRRRRVRLGQVGAVPLDHGPAAASNVERRASVRFDGHDIADARRQADARALGHGDGDGVPGPDDLAEPGHADRHADHRVAALPPRHEQARTPRSAALALLAVGGHPRARAALQRVPRTSSPAACASASSSPSPWPAAPSCCSPTSPPPRSTSPCRPRSSTCSQTQQRERTWRMILVTHDLGVVAGRTDESP